MDFEKYGIPGVIVTVLIAAIIWLAKYIDRKDEQHKKERDEFRETIENQFRQANQIQNDATRALTELSILIKTIKK